MLWIIAAMLITLVCTFYLSANQNKIVKQKQSLYAKHSEFIQRMQGLIDQLPEQYIPKEIHLLLLEEIIEHLKSQIKLFPSNKLLVKQVNERLAQRQQVSKSERILSVGEIGANDLKKANRIRKRLHQLCGFTERAINLKKIVRHEGIQLIHTMRSLSTEIAVAFHLALAEKSLQREKNKMAVYYYSRALNEYTKYNPQGRYDALIEKFKGTIEELRMQERSSPDREKKKLSSKESTHLSIEIDNQRRPGLMRRN